MAGPGAVMFTGLWVGVCQHRGVVHRVCLVGAPARVGKSSLAQRLLRSDGIAWLPTDVLRTVLRRVLPELDDLDQGDVSAAAMGALMYPHIEQAVEVCGEEAERFLIEGPDIVPSMVPRLSAALPEISIRACFLGNIGFSGDDLASYRGAEAAAPGRLTGRVGRHRSVDTPRKRLLPSGVRPAGTALHRWVSASRCRFAAGDPLWSVVVITCRRTASSLTGHRTRSGRRSGSTLTRPSAAASAAHHGLPVGSAGTVGSIRPRSPS